MQAMAEEQMPLPYSADLRERVLRAWEQGEGTAADLATRFRVSKATVNNWRRALRADGRRHAKTLGHGPAPRLDAGAREVLRELVTADNDATLAEYRDQLYERTGIRVSPEPISSDRWQGMENRPFPTLSVISDRSELPGIGIRRAAISRLVLLQFASS